MKKTIMIVDDEKEIADLLELYLNSDGYHVYKFYKGKDLLNKIEEVTPDLVLLDIMLPDLDGFTICKELRKKYIFPIIMLTAKVEESSLLMGLTVGADDYITKPFKPIEVLARVKTQLRRYTRYNPANAESPFMEEQEEYNIRGLVINNKKHKCTIFGEEIALTPIEFNILWYLCEHKGNVVSSEELFEAVWGERFLDNNNTVMTHIGRLREKMKEPARKPRFIKTVWGVGYQIEA